MRQVFFGAALALLFSVFSESGNTAPTRQGEAHQFKTDFVVSGKSAKLITRDYLVDVIDDIAPDKNDQCASNKRQLVLYRKDNQAQEFLRIPIGRANKKWDIGAHLWYDSSNNRLWVTGLEFPIDSDSDCDLVTPEVYVLDLKEEGIQPTVRSFTTTDMFDGPMFDGPALPTNVATTEKGIGGLFLNVLTHDDKIGASVFCTINSDTQWMKCETLKMPSSAVSRQVKPALKLRALKQDLLVSRASMVKPTAQDPVYHLGKSYLEKGRFPQGVMLQALKTCYGFLKEDDSVSSVSVFDGVELDYDTENQQFVLTAVAAGYIPFLMGIDPETWEISWQKNLGTIGFVSIYSLKVIKGFAQLTECYNNVAHGALINLKTGGVVLNKSHVDSFPAFLPPYETGGYTDKEGTAVFFDTWYATRQFSDDLKDDTQMLTYTFAHQEGVASEDHFYPAKPAPEIQITSATGVSFIETVFGYVQSLDGLGPTGPLDDQMIAIGLDGKVVASSPVQNTRNMSFCDHFQYFKTQTLAGVRNNVTEVFSSYTRTMNCFKSCGDCDTQDYIAKWIFY
ncbi:hypothetical protein [Endozoicomonas arenosclerae]|uniref:hypothetical protein n=1 Tax=Endozoicomonas arenosclerae TaxID=1633495 RepID=UPI000782DACA|nr:hypothetical protein [Endozoicomonas arenosclerae]